MAAIKGVTRITVAAGAAKPSPAIGQALGACDLGACWRFASRFI